VYSTQSDHLCHAGQPHSLLKTIVFSCAGQNFNAKKNKKAQWRKDRGYPFASLRLFVFLCVKNILKLP
jgi:hypothetical protein